MNQYIERLKNGIIDENPTFVQLLGMCPTLAVTTSAQNGLGMGLATLVVLSLSNMIISMLKKIIPAKVRIPIFIVVIATFVTLVEYGLKAFMPDLNKQLGIFIPLIVVNCVILGRAESYAYKNPVGLSFMDGIGMGIGFTISLTFIGMIRELLGNATIFNVQIMPSFYQPVIIFILAPGAFFVLGFILAGINYLKSKKANSI